MKILHTSDLHIGSPLTSRLPEGKVRERKGELLANFERMVEEALYQRVSVFIIAGDLFDSGKITRLNAERVLSAIEKCPSIDFLYLTGNHEGDALIDCGLTLPSNLKTFGDGWTYYDYGAVTVAGRNKIEENMFSSLDLNYTKTNVVVLHGVLKDGRSGGENIGKKELEGKHVDYLALGHYHSYSEEKIGDTGVAVYSGTPEGRGFDETGEKGFVLIDADGRHATHTFRPFAKRTLRTVEVDLTGASERAQVDERVNSALAGIKAADIVRVRLTGHRAPELFPDTDAVRSRWERSFYHFEIEDASKVRINPEDYKYDRSLKGEFIRLVGSKTNLTEDEKSEIIKIGLSALMGECDNI